MTMKTSPRGYEKVSPKKIAKDARMAGKNIGANDPFGSLPLAILQSTFVN